MGCDEIRNVKAMHLDIEVMPKNKKKKNEQDI
jgi:hypothetical protein